MRALFILLDGSNNVPLNEAITVPNSADLYDLPNEFEMVSVLCSFLQLLPFDAIP